MNEELTKQLWGKYPKIFAGKDKSIHESLIPFGFECGDGWFALIDTLCSHLQFHTDHNKHPQIEAVQVKEKFGGLRFYTESEDDFQHGIISFAEAMSAKICEDCGSTKNVTQTKGYIRSLCEECIKK